MDLRSILRPQPLPGLVALILGALLLASCQGQDIGTLRQKLRASMGIKTDPNAKKSIRETKLALEEDRAARTEKQEKGRGRLMGEVNLEEEESDLDDEIDASEDGLDPKGGKDKGEAEGRGRAVRPTVAGISKCPEGTTLAGAAPPKGYGQWCERNGGFFGRSVRIGPFMRWHPNGARSVQGNFVNGKPEGVFTNWHPDGRKAQETGYKGGLLQGSSIKYNKEGKKIFEGTFLAGAKHGRFLYFTRSGSPKSEGSFRSNIKEGVWTIYNAQGKPRSKITFRDGKKEGRAELFHPDGTMQSSGNYQDAKPVGLWTTYFRGGGKKSEGSYINGEKHGTWSFYDRSGAVTRSITYTEGRAQQDEKAAPSKKQRSAKKGRGRDREPPPRDPPVYEEAEEDFKEL